MQGSSSPQGGVSRIGFIKRDCLEDINTCPANIIVLPNIVAKDMAPNVMWSPDGQKVMFVSDLPGNQDVFIENIDGSNLTNITHSPEREDCPGWSPDGKYVLYDKESTAVGNPQVQSWIAKSDGSGSQLLTEGNCPSWSRDGSNILFTIQKPEMAIPGA
jgi:Tol biopolymer transport system component